MMVWLEAGSNPVRAFFNTSEPIGPTLPAIRHGTLRDVSNLRRPLSVGGGSDAANISIQIENSDGAMTAICAALIFQQAVIKTYDSATESFFSGTVNGVSIGSTITLSIVG
jgi:hypothetical protein